MNHEEWALKTTGDSLRGIAGKIGVNPGNFSRQIKTGLTADRVIAIAHAYNLNVVDALLATEHFNPADDPRTQDASFDAMLNQLKKLHDRQVSGNVQGVVQNDYELVADDSPEEGSGRPDDYES